MRQITIRRLKEGAIKRARELAKERGVSLNRVYLEAIERGLGVGEEPKRYGDLSKFAGDSNFGPDWDRILSEEIDIIDETEWR